MYSLAIYVGVGLVDSELSKSGEKTPHRKGTLTGGKGGTKDNPLMRVEANAHGGCTGGDPVQKLDYTTAL